MRLKELTKELGYEKGGHTLYWLISMATKPMLELNKLLGLENSSKAIEWLLKQPIVGAIKMKEIPTTSSSAMNIPAQQAISDTHFRTSRRDPRPEVISKTTVRLNGEHSTPIHTRFFYNKS
jgi:hypothetical protein